MLFCQMGVNSLAKANRELRFYSKLHGVALCGWTRETLFWGDDARDLFSQKNKLVKAVSFKFPTMNPCQWFIFQLVRKPSGGWRIMYNMFMNLKEAEEAYETMSKCYDESRKTKSSRKKG